jgi:hypothetical protein
MPRPVNTEKAIPFVCRLYEAALIGFQPVEFLGSGDGVGVWTGGARHIRQRGKEAKPYFCTILFIHSHLSSLDDLPGSGHDK